MKRCGCRAALAISVLFLAAAACGQPVAEGVVHLKSSHNVADTVERAKRMIAYYKLQWHGVLDHAQALKQAGVEIPPTQTIYWSDPEIQANILAENRLAALTLPLTLLVWEDLQSIVWVSYVPAEYLFRQYPMPQAAQRIKKIKKIQKQLSTEVAQ